MKSYEEHKKINGRLGVFRHFKMKPIGNDDYKKVTIGNKEFLFSKGKLRIIRKPKNPFNYVEKKGFKINDSSKVLNRKQRRTLIYNH